MAPFFCLAKVNGAVQSCGASVISAKLYYGSGVNEIGDLMAVAVIIDGVERTIPECVNQGLAKVSMSKIYSRISDGWDPREAVLTPLQVSPLLYEAWGEGQTLSHWLRRDHRCVITSEVLFRKRIEEGWTVEDALSTPYSRKQHVHNGEAKTLSEWACDDRCEVPEGTFYYRVTQLRWSVGDALKRRSHKQYEAFGESRSLSEWLEDDRCVVDSYYTVHDRIHKSDWTVEDALMTPLLRPKSYWAFGEEKKLGEWVNDSRCLDANPRTLRSRLTRSGMPPEKAFVLPVSEHFSHPETQVADFVESLGVEVIRNDRTLISPKEIDIYIPEKNMAIEFNGVYWHSDKHIPREYHYEKWRACKEEGVQLLQIWEDDWRDRLAVIQSMICHKLGLTEQRLFARNTVVDPDVPTPEARKFLEANHIQGFISGKHYYGLRYRDEVVALMVLMVDTTNVAEWTLSRFATSVSVVGGFSKLLKAFRNNHDGSIKSFADLEVSDGGLYRAHGFIEDALLPPDYSYVLDETRVHKFLFRKERFRNDPNLKYHESLTESELANLNGLRRVYDSGKIRFLLPA